MSRRWPSSRQTESVVWHHSAQSRHFSYVYMYKIKSNLRNKLFSQQLTHKSDGHSAHKMRNSLNQHALLHVDASIKPARGRNGMQI
jgi:hypothetical protein